MKGKILLMLAFFFFLVGFYLYSPVLAQAPLTDLYQPQINAININVSILNNTTYFQNSTYLNVTGYNFNQNRTPNQFRPTLVIASTNITCAEVSTICAGRVDYLVNGKRIVKNHLLSSLSVGVGMSLTNSNGYSTTFIVPANQTYNISTITISDGPQFRLDQLSELTL